ncbi:MAG: tRNA (adenosine(37)-N6)-threonylcarbamoyltransferase complex dimerization subunit type 1 TsaB [Vulcanococcus sp.]
MNAMAQAEAPLLLALHSSSETLAVAICGLASAGQPQRLDRDAATSAAFPLGRGLSNALFGCVEQLLPAEQWPRLARLVVATGPGGFTGTRLTVVLARTLAQQLAIPLHGFSSFLLMARRLQAPGAPMQSVERFWLQQPLPRRGSVAGCYGPEARAFGGIAELELPRLWRPDEPLPWPAEPVLEAAVDPLADVHQLLELGCLAQADGLAGPWQPVLPLYPTSPVEGL